MHKTFNVLHQTVIFLVFLPFALLAENHINLKIGEEVTLKDVYFVMARMEKVGTGKRRQSSLLFPYPIY